MIPTCGGSKPPAPIFDIKKMNNNIFTLKSWIVQNTSTKLEVFVPEYWQLGFQKPATSVMEGVVFFHDDLFLFLTFICFFVLYMLWACLTLFSNKKVGNVSIRFVHASVLEIVWTLIPAMILILIAIPSFSLLYSIDEILDPFFTIKAIGHQWYWSYELIDNENLQTLFNSFLESENGPKNAKFSSISTEGFDSYLVPDDELAARGSNFLSNVRLLTVDNHLWIPTDVPTRIMVSSADVLHSWAVPSLGIKIDACPGRINQTSVLINRSGIFYGQCSEICGVNHGFMPIGILSIDSTKYNSDEFMMSRELISTLDPIIAGVSTVVNELEDK